MIGALVKGSSKGIRADGAGNIVVGSNAIFASTSDYNVAIGRDSLNSSTTGLDYNVGIGVNSLTACENGDYNVGIGYDALSSLVGGGGTVGDANVAIGHEAGKSCLGNLNTFIGYQAGIDLNDAGQTQNTVIGYRAMYQAAGDSGTDKNVAIGSYALEHASFTGRDNIAIGSYALEDITTGDYNIGIGSSAGIGFSTQDNILVIGHRESTSYDGYIIEDNYVSIGHYNEGIQMFAGKVQPVTTNAGTGDGVATDAPLCKIPAYGFIKRIVISIRSKGAGTHLYNLAIGTASDEGAGDTVAGRIELLGANNATGCVTRTQGTQDADSDIDASTGSNNKRIWIAEIEPSVNDSSGWLDQDMYLYLCNSGAGNATSGTMPRIGFKVEFYGKE